MRIDILSLFPDYFRGPFDESIVKRALNNNLIEIGLVDIRAFASGKHRRVDDRPFGGGPGMVLMPEPVTNAIRSVKKDNSKVIYLSPQGKHLTHTKCRELAACPHLILLCGHYEGIDERVLKNEVDEEISIGDYVLTNGCLAAIVLTDSVIRFIPGVLGHDEAASSDSFEQGIFDHAHYTKPITFEGESVPEVLLSGNHGEIEKFRLSASLEKTMQVRPDLFVEHVLKDAPDEHFSDGRLVILTHNIKKSLKFYCEFLGATLKSHTDHCATIAFDHFELLIVLFGKIESEKLPHTIVELRINKDRFAKLATSKDDKFICKDPDGNILKLVKGV